jgi:transposase
MKVLKQVSGIDVSQKELVVTLGRLNEDLTIELYANRVFKNSTKGIDSSVKWTEKMTTKEAPVQYVMEATGVYHQKLAYYLDERGFEVSVVMPNKISNYMRTLENKTITDKTSSEAIAQFGLERKLDHWHRPDLVYKKLQQLTRERDQVVSERVMVKNMLHAEQSEAEPNPNSVKRIKARIQFLSKQELQIKKEIDQCVESNGKLKADIKNICTIPGVGQLTAVVVLAETNGFNLIRNKKQLTSYAGLDVKEKLSGTSVKGKPRISKKGNTAIRKAMHLPSLSAIKHDERFKGLFARLVSRHGVKMKAVVAVQRKLLELIYLVYKNNTVYQKDYEESKRVQLQVVNTL